LMLTWIRMRSVDTETLLPRSAYVQVKGPRINVTEKKTRNFGMLCLTDVF
jgi:hypothetical protein